MREGPFWRVKLEKITKYLLPDSLTPVGLIDEISKRHSTLKQPAFEKKQTFYDTFDSRLYKNGLILSHVANEIHLLSLDSEAAIERNPIKTKRVPKFWWELPVGSLKDKLQSYLDVRALIPLVVMSVQGESLRILNDDEKTVLRLQLEHVQTIADGLKKGSFHTVKLLSVRGYIKEFHQFRQFLKDLGLKQDPGNILETALSATGEKPPDYSSKINIELTANLTAEQATKRILSRLLQIMQQNENGIKADLDTEFLHDFRVAVRRTRSALTQIKGVFPAEITLSFKHDFAHLGKLTNRLRDLDVYLLKEAEYRKMLPEGLRPGLTPLFQSLNKERKQEHRKLVKALETESYKKVLTSWQAFLSPDENGQSNSLKNAQKPVIQIARKFIFKKFNQVIAIGEKIDDSTPDEQLHRLRIECKKLRYLLEFFSSLFPKEKIATLIKQLKKLQDNLGDFNDLSVQQKNLQEYLEKISPKDDKSLDTPAAIGGLIAVLHQKQQNVRSAFSQTFSHFSSPENTRLFSRLFA